MVRYLLL